MNKIGQNRDAPAYQEYAASMMSRFEYRNLILEARGLLYTLRLECWVNQRLPSDPEILAKSLGLPAQQVKDLLPLLFGTFLQVTEGAIQCPELEDYRKTIQDRRNRQSEGGKKARAGDRHNRERLISLESRMQLLSEDKRNPVQKNTVSRADESHEAWIRDYEGLDPENDK
jgi:hypothetical protein